MSGYIKNYTPIKNIKEGVKEKIEMILKSAQKLKNNPGNIKEKEKLISYLTEMKQKLNSDTFNKLKESIFTILESQFDLLLEIDREL